MAGRVEVPTTSTSPPSSAVRTREMAPRQRRTASTSASKAARPSIASASSSRQALYRPGGAGSAPGVATTIPCSGTASSSSGPWAPPATFSGASGKARWSSSAVRVEPMTMARTWVRSHSGQR